MGYRARDLRARSTLGSCALSPICTIFGHDLGNLSVSNSEGFLSNIDNFHVANSMLPQDILHILLEGVFSKDITTTYTIYL